MRNAFYRLEEYEGHLLSLAKPLGLSAQAASGSTKKS